MNKNIPYGKQFISREDIESVINALNSDYLTQGPIISQFENNFSNYIGNKYSVAVSNGTAALHLCAMALNIKPGQKVITSPITFAATANCIRYCGGDVVFADIDPNTYLLDINYVKKLLESSPIGTYSGIIVVDFAGRPVNLESFKKLAVEYNLWLLEDSCHAPGGYFNDSQNSIQKCGNGIFADLAIFSFHPVKHIACGEGGMITTNSKDLYEKLLTLRTHGIVKDPSKFINKIEFSGGDILNNLYPGWYMEMQELGYNYRLTDFQAALGISQLKRAEEGLQKRHEIANRYYEAFRDSKFVIGQSDYLEGHAYHLYILEVYNRYGLYNYLKEHGIYSQIHYIPCHLMPYYRALGWKEGDMKFAERYYQNCISLPMYPTLTIEEQVYVIEIINKFYKG